jgi:hypothetical protein
MRKSLLMTKSRMSTSFPMTMTTYQHMRKMTRRMTTYQQMRKMITSLMIATITSLVTTMMTAMMRRKR